MNPIYAYGLKIITFEELEKVLWDMGPNQIIDIGEKCFAFYCNKANGFLNFDFYILRYGSGLNANDEWYCE